MQTGWIFCPDCQHVTNFTLDDDEEQCKDCGSVFERETSFMQTDIPIEIS
jgi:hypothetical protein